MDCIFCKIAKGEIPSQKVYEDENVYAFLDISPLSKGHTLVIPKKHYSTIYDIPEELLCDVMIVVKKISLHLREKLKCDGLNIKQNNGELAGQTVHHIHFHIVPKYCDEENLQVGIEDLAIEEL